MKSIGKEFVIFLMGPTASGKTELAIKICNYFNIDLISVDSAMIYKGMNIGTAKPDDSILKKYPHAMINICSPEDSFSVNEFISLAKKHIKKAIAKNKIPLLVGGSSFYFNALENGLSQLPESTKESKKYFNDKISEVGSVKLHKKLQKIDPVAANRIHKNDSQRITRALEVYHLSGKSLSKLQGNINKTFNYPIKKIILMPDRGKLHQNIEKRFKKMMQSGFIEELKKLRENKKLNLNLASMRCVGYRQGWQHLEGIINKEEMIEKAIIATRRLCKRQSTWLRDEKNALQLKNIDLDKVINFISAEFP